jgi:hypothetical protein
LVKKNASLADLPDCNESKQRAVEMVLFVHDRMKGIGEHTYLPRAYNALSALYCIETLFISSSCS